MTVDDDFHHRPHPLRQLRLRLWVADQLRTEFFVCAREAKFVFAARLRSAAGNASWKRHDDAWTTTNGCNPRLRGSQRRQFAFTEEPQIATHQAVGVSQAPIENKLAPQRRNPPHLPAKSPNPLLKPIPEIRDLAAHSVIGFAIDQVEARRRRTR